MAYVKNNYKIEDFKQEIEEYSIEGLIYLYEKGATNYRLNSVMYHMNIEKRDVLLQHYRELQLKKILQ